MANSRVAEWFADIPKIPFRERKSAACSHIFRGVQYDLTRHGERMERFWKALQSDAWNHAMYSIHEIPSPAFRMFFRFSFVLPERLGDEQVATLGGIVHKTAARFFGTGAAMQIPGFFEQIWLESKPLPKFSLRSDLLEFLRKKPLLAEGAAIKITNDSIQLLNGELLQPEWRTPPKRDAIYKIRDVEGGVVTLVSPDMPPPQFVNPMVYTESCAKLLCSGPAPDGALSFDQELANSQQSASQPVHYTSDTVIALDGDVYFRNTHRECGGVLHELHVVMPEIAVTVEQALCMREALIAALSLTYGTAPETMAPNGWHAVLDTMAYSGDGDGLRMYGSEKLVDCACGSKQGCYRDCKNGKVFGGQRLELRTVFMDGFVATEHVSHYQQHTELLLNKTSIRTPPNTPPTPGWHRYDGCPKHVEEIKTVINKNGETVTKIEKKASGKSFKMDRKIARTNVVGVQDQEVIATLQQLIRTRFPAKKYAKLCVSSVQRTTDGETYFITVSGDGQHWCFNLNPPADHDDCTIYFQCQHDGLRQRCRCSSASTENRQNGSCKTFRSTPILLNKKEKLLFFGDLDRPASKRQR